MAVVAIILKVMPESPEVDMGELKRKVEAKIIEIGGMFKEAKEEPIAFGLKALVVFLGWNEDKDPDLIETELAKVENVRSVQITDVRRAFG